MSEGYVGINYAGPGSTTNTDPKTGIHYGVISQHSVNPDALDDIYQNGEDVAFQEAKQSCREEVKRAVDDWLMTDILDDKDSKGLHIIVHDVCAKYIVSSVAKRIADDVTADADPDWEVEDIVECVHDAMENWFGDGYESDGGLNDYLYEEDGLKLTGCLNSDMFVLQSPYYTYAQYCSPCVPGAGNLDHPMTPESGAPKCFCLDASWFENNKAPYRYWRVKDDSEVQPEMKT